MRLAPSLLRRHLEEARKHFARAERQLPRCAGAYLKERRRRLAAAASRVTAEPLMRRVVLAGREHGRLAERLPRAIDARLERQRAGLAQSERLLATLSHQGILERGFALVTDAAGSLVKRVEAVTPGAHLTLQFADGKAEAIATGEAARRPQAKDRAKLKGPGGQGSLF